MANLIELIEVFEQLNESNKFIVLVYARMKVALQFAAQCSPYIGERRRLIRLKYPQAHWVL